MSGFCLLVELHPEGSVLVLTDLEPRWHVIHFFNFFIDQLWNLSTRGSFYVQISFTLSCVSQKWQCSDILPITVFRDTSIEGSVCRQLATISSHYEWSHSMWHQGTYAMTTRYSCGAFHWRRHFRPPAQVYLSSPADRAAAAILSPRSFNKYWRA